jgi:hypothetical protein
MDGTAACVAVAEMRQHISRMRMNCGLEQRAAKDGA